MLSSFSCSHALFLPCYFCFIVDALVALFLQVLNVLTFNVLNLSLGSEYLAGIDELLARIEESDHLGFVIDVPGQISKVNRSS